MHKNELRKEKAIFSLLNNGSLTLLKTVIIRIRAYIGPINLHAIFPVKTFYATPAISVA